ncbi:MAG: PHP domain-containing protein [Acidobacteriota bacterium]
MDERIDLHIHSDRSSDGDYPPREIVRLGRKHNLRAIAIADHDSVAAYPEALKYGQEFGLEVIPNIELTTIFNQREFHLLLPFIDWKKPFVEEIVQEVVERRRREAKKRTGKLQELGFDIEWEEVEQSSAPFAPLGVTIAQVLLKKPGSKKDPRLEKYLSGSHQIQAPYLFYKDYFMEGKPASVPRQNLSLTEVLDKSHLTGGVPVLAHPGAYFQQATEEDIRRLKEKGLAGLEVYSSYHDSEEKEKYLCFCQKFDLIPTAGSDFHGSIKPHVKFGGLQEGGCWMVEKLKERRP